MDLDSNDNTCKLLQSASELVDSGSWFPLPPPAQDVVYTVCLIDDDKAIAPSVKP